MFGKGGLDGPDATGVEMVSGWDSLVKTIELCRKHAPTAQEG